MTIDTFCVVTLLIMCILQSFYLGFDVAKSICEKKDRVKKNDD